VIGITETRPTCVPIQSPLRQATRQSKEDRTPRLRQEAPHGCKPPIRLDTTIRNRATSSIDQLSRASVVPFHAPVGAGRRAPRIIAGANPREGVIIAVRDRGIEAKSSVFGRGNRAMARKRKEG
jgi:hypothetical protein